MFENHPKSRIQNCQQTGQTVLPDRSFLIDQKWVKNAKIEKFQCDILSDFQPLCYFVGMRVVTFQSKRRKLEETLRRILA